MQVYVTPRGFLTSAGAAEAVAGKWAWPFLGDEHAFTAIELHLRNDGAVKRLGTFARKAFDGGNLRLTPDVNAAVTAQCEAMASPRADFAGQGVTKPVVMGVLNVTPDSFSDGGRFEGLQAATAHAGMLCDSGAAIIDVGGESTRPGATNVTEAEESVRVLPVVEALAARGISVSIDTRHTKVMADAIAAGAAVVNDITALADKGALELIAKSNAVVILMHMQGTPSTMQNNPTYVWAPGDIYDFFVERLAACAAAGIPKSRIALDPGFGFGKTDVHNAEVMDHLALFHSLGCVLAVGASRKASLGRMSRGEPVTARLPGSLAAAIHAVRQGAQIVRVHDVAETHQALAVTTRLITGT